MSRLDNELVFKLSRLKNEVNNICGYIDSSFSGSYNKVKDLIEYEERLNLFLSLINSIEEIEHMLKGNTTTAQKFKNESHIIRMQKEKQKKMS